jgi:hypothetical protein
MLENAEAEQQRRQAQAWNDPLSNTDTGRLKSDKSGLNRASMPGKSGSPSMSGKSGTPSVSGKGGPGSVTGKNPVPKKKSWLGRLLG